MPINTQHSQYDQYSPQWEKCRAVIEGEEAVKKCRTKYLPPVSDNQTDASYRNYLMRALFFNATSRTAQALLGFLFRKPPLLQNKNDDASFFDSLPLASENFSIFVKGISKEVIDVGRVGIICDVFEDGQAKLTRYKAEDIINWKNLIHDGRQELSWIVLREYLEDFSKDEFEAEKITQYRVLYLEDDIYKQRVFQQTKDDKIEFIEEIIPSKNGVALNFIPFVIINQNNLQSDIEKPTLIDLVNVNLSHYRSSADLEQGRHYTALPTPVVTGFDETSKLEIGANVAWLSDNVDAKAYFLEFTGKGLSFVENALKEKEAMMSVLGARLLEAQKKGVEAADTYKIRNAGEQSILSNIAHTLDSGLTWICRVCEAWRGLGDFDKLEESELKVTINKDYVVTNVEPSLVTALFGALQGGAISENTWFYNLQQWEMIEPGQTLDDELALIEARQPSV